MFTNPGWSCGLVTACPPPPFDENQAREALAAFDRYGKGIHPRVRLNLSDCVAYALAKSMNCALPFKGNDFAQTDVDPAP
jgi:ribonuclease VapC